MTALTKHDEASAVLVRRELWQPDRDEQMAAIEVLLASSIPTELRNALREREFQLATRIAR